MIKNLKKKKGFTLIELIIVIAILGILAAIAIPKFGAVQVDAKIKSDVATAKTIADAATIAVSKGDIALGTDYVSFADLDSKITNYLQNSTPVAQSISGSKFQVQINSSGIVQVKIIPTADTTLKGVGVTSANGALLYPTPASPYNQ